MMKGIVQALSNGLQATKEGCLMRAIRWEEIVETHPFPGVTTQRFDTDRTTIVRYRFEPDASFPLHAHPEEQIVAVLQGRVEFQVGNRVLHMVPGDLCHVEPDEPHGARAGKEPVEMLNILSPRRTGDTIRYVGR